MTITTTTIINDVLGRLHGVTCEREGQWQARCPAHEDKNPSLSVGIGDDGRVLLDCKAGCSFDAVVQALGLRKADLFPSDNGRAKANVHKRIVAAYDYTDAQGELLYQCVRFEPKDFRQRRPDGNGGWFWNLNGTPKVLYRLRDIIDADPSELIVICEGEKDAEALCALGFVATTCPMGAGKWRLVEDAILAGRRVAILPDRDDAGRKHALDVATHLHGRATEVRIVGLPGTGKDVSDWIESGGTAADLVKLIEAAPIFSPKAEAEAKATPTMTSASSGFARTDSGNAEALADRYGDRIRWSQGVGFCIYVDGRWTPDTTGEVHRLAMDTIRAMHREAAKLSDAERKERIAHALRSESDARINAMLNRARYLEGIAVDDRAWDRDPWLFNTSTGTIEIDPETGEHRHRRHDPADLITKLAPIAYDPEATCPRFTRFLRDIFCDDDDLIRFAQRAVGACLVGIPEEVLHVGHGLGENGKTTFCNALANAFGDYMVTMPQKFLAQKYGETVPHDLMDLRGARLAISHEPDQRMTLDESKVKYITGRDEIKARKLYHDLMTFSPSHTLLLLTNHKPTVRTQTRAIWRRIKLWPFDFTVPPGTKDATLPEKLKAEASGILNWLLIGCAEWVSAGRDCDPPEAIQTATDEYQRDEDIIGDWLGACTKSGPARTAFADLYGSYEGWARRNGFEKPLSKKKLSMLLEEHGVRRRLSAGRPYFEGIQVVIGGDRP